LGCRPKKSGVWRSESGVRERKSPPTARFGLSRSARPPHDFFGVVAKKVCPPRKKSPPPRWRRDGGRKKVPEGRGGSSEGNAPSPPKPGEANCPDICRKAVPELIPPPAALPPSNFSPDFYISHFSNKSCVPISARFCLNKGRFVGRMGLDK